MAKTGTFDSSHEVPVECTPVVAGALSQVLDSQTIWVLAGESYASSSTSLHTPPSTGADDAVAGTAVWAEACAGSPVATPEGTSPTRVATTGIRSVAPCAPHSLLCTVCVCTPRSVPSGCGVNDQTTVSDCVAVCVPCASRHCVCTCRGALCQCPSTKCRTPVLPVPAVFAASWLTLSSFVPVAAHPVTVQAELKAHQPVCTPLLLITPLDVCFARS